MEDNGALVASLNASIFIDFKGKELLLLAGMLVAVSTCLDCRCPAFWECAEPFPTVLPAGLEPAHHLVGAARNPTFPFTATMFGAETSSERSSGAICHRALLLLLLLLAFAARAAILKSLSCGVGACIKLALIIRTVLDARLVCYDNIKAAMHGA